jgi:hypothetical protein
VANLVQPQLDGRSSLDRERIVHRGCLAHYPKSRRIRLRSLMWPPGVLDCLAHALARTASARLTRTSRASALVLAKWCLDWRHPGAMAPRTWQIRRWSSRTILADVVLKAASAARPKLRYTVGGLASRLRLLRRFAPAGLVNAGIRRDLRLDVMPVVKTS